MTDETLPDLSSEPVGTATAEQTAEDGEEAKKDKLNQIVDIADTGPCKKHIKVTVDRGDIDKLLDEKFTELMTDAVVPGFRPGKAPRKVITRRFHKEVTDKVAAELLLASLEQLAEDHDIAPLAAPEIDPATIVIPQDGPFIYEFDVEVRPQFDLPNYKGLKLKRPMHNFTDEDVAREERRDSVALRPAGAQGRGQRPAGRLPHGRHDHPRRRPAHRHHERSGAARR